MNVIDTVKPMRTVDNVPAPRVMVNANDIRRGTPSAPQVFVWSFGSGTLIQYGSGTSVNL